MSIKAAKDRDKQAAEKNRLALRGQGEVTLYNEDCITGMANNLADASIDLVVSSIPFAALFSYSHKTEDIGNNQDGIDLHEGQFGLHTRFCFEQIYRVLRPGTLFCCHIQQLYTTKVQHGFMGIRDFRGSVITLARNTGFEHQGEVAIPKDPVAMVQRSQKHSLQWITGYGRNSRNLSPAANDFLLIFRKPGEGKPIQALYHREKNPKGWVSLIEWQNIARGTWDDILEIDTLDGWRSARESDEEKHVCPLQLTVIRRCIWLYSAPGETVLDPFNGIGSTSWVALEQGRNAIGFDLKEYYHDLAQRNIAKAKRQWAQAQEAGMPLLAAMCK